MKKLLFIVLTIILGSCVVPNNRYEKFLQVDSLLLSSSVVIQRDTFDIVFTNLSIADPRQGYVTLHNNMHVPLRYVWNKFLDPNTSIKLDSIIKSN